MIRKAILIISVLFFVGTSASAYYNPGTPTGYVNDYANILSPATKASLESGLTQFEQTTKHQIAVVTITNLQGDTVENFAVQLFKDWGIGQKSADNGVLFLISKEDRQMRIEVGYGLEGALTDLQSGQIISQIARPAFQNNDFDGGVSASVTAIEKAIQGEPVTGDVQSAMANPSNAKFFIFYGLIIFFIIWRGIFAVLGKSKSWWLGGAIGVGIGALLGLIWGTLIIIIILAVILGGLGLISDWGASRRDWFKNRGGRGGGGIWFLGGGGGRSGGGGFGGFGGGGSGGGGASGGW